MDWNFFQDCWRWHVFNWPCLSLPQPNLFDQASKIINDTPPITASGMRGVDLAFCARRFMLIHKICVLSSFYDLTE